MHDLLLHYRHVLKCDRAVGAPRPSPTVRKKSPLLRGPCLGDAQAVWKAERSLRADCSGPRKCRTRYAEGGMKAVGRSNTV